MADQNQIKNSQQLLEFIKALFSGNEPKSTTINAFADLAKPIVWTNIFELNPFFKTIQHTDDSFFSFCLIPQKKKWYQLYKNTWIDLLHDSRETHLILIKKFKGCLVKVFILDKRVLFVILGKELSKAYVTVKAAEAIGQPAKVDVSLNNNVIPLRSKNE